MMRRNKHNNEGTPSYSAHNVKDLVQGEAKVLRTFLSLLPEDCYVYIIGGSPCTELTTGGGNNGILGLTGPASCLFYVMHLIVIIYD